MPYFCKLSDPGGYRACDWDLTGDASGRAAWLEVFREHTTSLLDHSRRSDRPPPERALLAYHAAFEQVLERVRVEPAAFGPLNIYKLCELRAELMTQFEIGDPYDRVKRAENEAALRHLARWLRILDEADPGRIVELLVRGVLAGNKFDLGAKETTDLHAQGNLDFFSTLESLAARPWFRDDLDVLRKRLAPRSCGYRHAVYFVDNAGGDVVLGVIPFARYLADQDCRVVLAANDEPSLNDVTASELGPLLEQAAERDPRLGAYLHSGRISVVGTGCDCPLIDLSEVSYACNCAAAECDLLILEGMGRAVETNYLADFTCDCIHLAMIKNKYVAGHLGCGMFDLVARFTPATVPGKGDGLVRHP